jgi:aryl-alcohol dehydrogenase-like predicted oxidoreductase
MEYKYLGSTGILVSQLGFGTMTFGNEADENISRELFGVCRDAGINLFDCANVYGRDGEATSEKILGKLIKDCREEIIITSKVGAQKNGGLSRRSIMSEVEKSLKNLGTDRIDIYFIHKMDVHTPLEETLRAFDDLQRQGKILHPAISNAAAWQVEKALGISLRERFSPIACIQPMYNLVKRQAEVEILPMAETEHLGVLTYSPLAAGLLTGKYAHSKGHEVGRIGTNSMYSRRYQDPQYFQTADKFVAFAHDYGFDPVALAVAWVMTHPAVTAPLIGARNIEQLKASLAAVDIEMNEELRKEVSKLSNEPQPATDRSEELL